jgi:hypothetical protein
MLRSSKLSLATQANPTHQVTPWPTDKTYLITQSAPEPFLVGGAAAGRTGVLEQPTVGGAGEDHGEPPVQAPWRCWMRLPSPARHWGHYRLARKKIAHWRRSHCQCGDTGANRSSQRSTEPLSSWSGCVGRQGFLLITSCDHRTRFLPIIAAATSTNRL